MLQAFIAKFYEAVIIALTAFLLLAVVGFGVQTWRVNHWESKAQNAKNDCYDKILEINQEHQKSLTEKQNTINQVSADYEKSKSEQRVQVETVTKEVQKIVERPVYINECFDDDGLSELNSLISSGTK